MTAEGKKRDRIPPHVRKYIGNQIAKACAETGTPYGVLGDCVDVWAGAVKSWVIGKVCPTPYELYKVSLVLGKPLEWFIAGADPDDTEATLLSIKAVKAGLQE